MLIDLSNKTWGTGNYSPNISERLTPVFNQILEAFDKYHTEKARSKFLKEIGFIKEEEETRKETQMKKGTVDVGSPDWNDMAKSMMSQGTVVTPESGPLEKMIPTEVDVPTGRMKTSYDPSVLSKFGIGDVTIPGSGGVTASGKAQNPFAGAIPQADGLNIGGTVIPWDRVSSLTKGGVGFNKPTVEDPIEKSRERILAQYNDPITGFPDISKMSDEDKRIVYKIPPDITPGKAIDILSDPFKGQWYKDNYPEEYKKLETIANQVMNKNQPQSSPANNAIEALGGQTKNLPSDMEIVSDLIKSGATKESDAVPFLIKKYGMDKNQALKFVRSH